MQYRKAVIFIVEGKTDKVALEKIFQKLYRSNRQIIFKFTSGDLSSSDDVTESNVEDKIYAIITDFMRETKLKKNDIFQITQLFDTDGTYIPPDAIKEGDSNEIVYEPTCIRCKDKSKVISRNSKKSSVMDYLLGLSQIKGIPYEMYYMSCNLDHALYNQQNLKNEQKLEYADVFYEHFLNKEKYFIDFLNSKVVNGVPSSYPQSWQYIKEDLHSLQRHTNLHLYFTNHPII